MGLHSSAQTGNATRHKPSVRMAWRRAFERAVPIVLGYLPVGFAYGVLAQKTGLSTFNAVAMSVLVFAGSATLIAVGLFASGAGAASIIVTTFVVNLRHLLMSAALAPHVRSWRKTEQGLFAFQLTDETFALHAGSFPKGVPVKAEAFSVNVIAQMVSPRSGESGDFYSLSCRRSTTAPIMRTWYSTECWPGKSLTE